MGQKNSKAQSGLEYLMTYGWALILIAAVIGVLVFVASSPDSDITFSSSDPTKIMIKSGNLYATTITVIVQNITGGNITITYISATGDSYTTCTINQQTTNIDILAGETMLLECPLSGEDPTGAVVLTYTDFTSLQREAIIRIAGGTGTAGGSPAELCESGGTGTVGDPIMVTTLAELDNVRNDLSAYYEMCQNIDASETSLWNEDLPGNPETYFGFVPIPNFAGDFNGNGYNISNLHINRPLESSIGLFGSLTGSVSNLGVLNVDIIGDSSVGAVVGSVIGGTIANSYSSGTVSASGSNTGGLAGSAFSGQISDSYSAAKVFCPQSVGGLVGEAFFGSIDRSYATGSVSGTNSVAGLVGYAWWVFISDSYATGSATGTGWVAGLVGWKEDDARINRCYSTGAVSGSTDVGGLVGEEDHPTTNVFDSFWDTDTSGQPTSDGGTGKTTAEMMQQATFTGWDFATIWNINEGTSYPFLKILVCPFLLVCLERHILQQWA